MPDRGATEDYSTQFLGLRVPATALRAGLCGGVVVGSVLLAIAEFTALVEVTVGALDTVTRTVDGRDNHGYALLAVAGVSLPAAWLALAGRRAAGAAILMLGVVALVVALAVDRPDTRASADVPEAVAFQDARARAGPGLGLELAGGLVLVLAGGGLTRLDFRRRSA